MKKCLIAFIMLLFLSYFSWAGQLVPIFEDIASSAECVETYNPAATPDDAQAVGKVDNADFFGYIYDPAQDECICAVDPFIWAEDGDPNGNYYYALIFERSGDATPTLDSYLGVSDRVQSDGINGNTPNRFSTLTGSKFLFSPCIDVYTAQADGYAIVFVKDTDSNPLDDPAPELDVTNVLYFGFDNDTGNSGDYHGRGTWSWNATLGSGLGTPLANYNWDADDFGDINVSTQ